MLKKIQKSCDFLQNNTFFAPYRVRRLFLQGFGDFSTGFMAAWPSLPRWKPLPLATDHTVMCTFLLIFLRWCHWVCRKLREYTYDSQSLNIHDTCINFIAPLVTVWEMFLKSTSTWAQNLRQGTVLKTSFKTPKRKILENFVQRYSFKFRALSPLVLMYTEYTHIRSL